MIVFLVRLHNTKSYLYILLDKMVLTEYSYVFAIGTFFALLDAYNNGASTSTIHLSESSILTDCT